MIAKCIVIFAIVAQISSACNAPNCECSSRKALSSAPAAPSTGAVALPAAAIARPVAAVALPAAPVARPVAAVALPAAPLAHPVLGKAAGPNKAIVRNIFAKGKYPVAVSNCGPTPDKHIPITTTHSTAPLQEKPTIRLPANIPAPKVIDHYCTCYKTLLRPRVHDHYVTVPSVQRYIETKHTPVIEHIHYEAVPVNCKDDSDNKFYLVKNGQQNAPKVACGPTLVAPAVPLAHPVATCAAPAVPIAHPVATCAAPAVPIAHPVATCAAPAVPIAHPVATCAAPVHLPCQKMGCLAAAPAIPACPTPLVGTKPCLPCC